MALEGSVDFSDVNLTVVGSTFLNCTSVCRSASTSGFLVSVGGGINLCTYGNSITDLHVHVTDSNFTECSADYGESASFFGAVFFNLLASETCRT